MRFYKFLFLMFLFFIIITANKNPKVNWKMQLGIEEISLSL